MLDVFYSYLSKVELDDTNSDIIESLMNGMYYLNFVDPFKEYDNRISELTVKFNMEVPNEHVKNTIEIYKKLMA